MPHDDFGTERYRLERVLDILEGAADRLNVRAHVPPSLLRDAVEFLGATENTAYGDTEESESDLPLSACVQQHVAARVPLEAMERSLAAVERGQTQATAAFVRAARKYIQLRRDHLRADDQLFAGSAAPAKADAPGVEAVETASARRSYQRLIEESATLDIGRPSRL
jgi:hemerythrin-like domain-containing protein